MYTKETLLAARKNLPLSTVYGELVGCQDWGAGMRQHVPSRMQDSFLLWVAFGIRPGGFLTAVLCDDLFGAYRRSDYVNRACMLDWIRFLHNYAPAGCYGSPGAVDEWVGLVNDERYRYSTPTR